MSQFWSAGAGALVSLAVLVPTSAATSRTPSGDTCAATGSGTSYALVVTLPSSASEQGAFAFGAPGLVVKSINAPGNPGTFSTKGLPAKTTGSWVLASPTPPGSSFSASLTTSQPVTGSFNVVPAMSSGTAMTAMTYLDPIPCEVSKVTIRVGKLTVASHATYVSAIRAWHLAVTINGAGVVSAIELEPTVGTLTPAQKTAKSRVQARSKGLKSAGTLTLTLKPTSVGLAALRKSGSIKVKLTVSFSPTGGKPGSKIVSLTLKK